MANLPTTNNNPGDLRFVGQDTATPGKGGFASFPDPKTGYAALLNDLQAKINHKPDATLADFANVYAPPSDNNNSAKYAADLANKLGVAPNATLKELEPKIGQLAEAIASNEGYQGQQEAASGQGNVQTQPGGAMMQPPALPGQSNQQIQPPLNGYAPPTPPDTNLEQNKVGISSGGSNNPWENASPLQNIASGNSEANVDRFKGSIKGILQTLRDVSGVDTNPVVKGQLAAAPEFAKDVEMEKEFLTPRNSAQMQGSQDSQLLAGLLGPGSEAKAGVSAIKNAPGRLLEQAVQDVMPLQNKVTRIDELRNTLPSSAPGTGGVVRKGLLGKSVPVASAEDVARGQAAQPYVSGTKDPIQKIGNLNQGIIDESTKTDTFLNSKSASGNFSDMRDYLETNRPTSNLQKDPGADEAYNRATQDALDTLYSTMKGTAEKTGDFGPKVPGADIRQARIAIDQQISKELGENTFGTPQFKGIKAAEIDIRNLLNRMNEDMLRYPGQMEQLNRMNKFIAQSTERGIKVDMENPEVRAQLEDSFGLKPTGEADAAELATQHEKMSHLYDARDNLIDKYQSSLGKNKLQENIANNPLLKTGYEIGKKSIPFGLGNHF